MFHQIVDRPEGWIDVHLPLRWKVAAITFHDADGKGIVRLGLLRDAGGR